MKYLLIILLPFVCYSQSQQMNHEIGGFITPQGAVAYRAYVGSDDTLYHGMIVQPSQNNASPDSIKVRSALSDSEWPIGVAYNPWCDTCRLVNTQVLIISSGVAQCLLYPADTSITATAGSWVRTGTSNEYLGFAHPSTSNETPALHDKECGHTVSAFSVKDVAQTALIPTYPSNAHWRRYYIWVNIHFR